MFTRRFPHGRMALVAAIVLWLAVSGSCGGDASLNPGSSGTAGALSLSRGEVLAELDGLQCPPGAAPTEFAALKDALRGELLARNQERFSSAAPESAASAVDDFAVEPITDDQANLSWTYRNQGDYNQDKLVAVSDLTPIGVHFGVGEGDPSWNNAQIADGNGDGLVTVSDITPIGQYYLARVEGYQLQSSSDGIGGWQTVTTYLFEASQLQLSGRRAFSEQLDAAVNGSYYRVVPYDGSHTGIPSNAEQFLVTGGQAPVINTVSPQSGQAGTQVTFSPQVSGDAPLSYSWDFGGGATPDSSEDSAPTVTLGSTGQYSAQLTVTNAYGEDSLAFTLTVTAEPSQPPVIDSAIYNPDTWTLTVNASDPDAGDILTLTVTEPTGLLVDRTIQVATAAGPFSAQFLWTAEDPFAGGSGETTVTVEDPSTATDSTGVEITVPAIMLAPDTLYAIPERIGAGVDEPVRIVVVTGTPASPFQYLNMVGLTVENGAALGPGSFNPGSVGGGPNDVDGYWAAMDPAPVGMLSPPELFIDDVDIGGGQTRWEFTLAPWPGEDETEAAGVLFNFEFSFGAPGTYTLGFQRETGDVKRTYYSDQAENEYFWGDITNEHDGVPNSIEVY